MPSKKEVWSEFSDEINAVYIARKGFNEPFIVHEYNGFNIALTTYVISTGNSYVTYTTVFVAFLNSKEIQFKLTKKNFIHRLFKTSSKKIIETGQVEFDYSYRIKGNNDIYISKIFADYDLQDLLTKQKQMYLAINNNKGMFKKLNKNLNKKLGLQPNDDISILYYQHTGVIKDKNRLDDLIKLFEKLVDKFLDLNIIQQG